MVMDSIGRPAEPTGQGAQERKAQEAVVRVLGRIADVPEAQWDACARGDGASTDPPNPFVSHAFLRALEESGSAAPDTGWLPQHLLFEDDQGQLLACLPCYL